MSDFTDTSYAPIGTALRYRRGDGALVTISVENPDKPAASLLELAAAPTLPPITASPVKLAMLQRLEGRHGQGTVPGFIAAATPPVANARACDVFDHPHVGGAFTIFVLCYGPTKYHEMHRRCLDSIIATVPRERMDLRIGSNELCNETCRYIDKLQQDGLCTKHYRHQQNIYKYPLMREMFRDPDHPIQTKWLIWFDDDSMADVEPAWLSILGQQIIKHHPEHHMFGSAHIWALRPGQAEFYRSRPWFRGRGFRTNRGTPSPNASCILFATGGFWALSKEAMLAADIPDSELVHTGGDYTIGQQLWEAGYKSKLFNGDKQFIRTSSVAHRGPPRQEIGAR